MTCWFLVMPWKNVYLNQNCKSYGEVDTTLESINQAGDISISQSGKSDFVVTDKLLQMMESQGMVNVNWKFDEKNSKQSSEKTQAT